MAHLATKHGCRRRSRPPRLWVPGVVCLAAACAELPVAPSTLMPHGERAMEGRVTPFYHGVFLGDAESTPDGVKAAIERHRESFGRRPALVKTFFRLDSDYSASGWAGRVLRNVASTGATNYVALDLRWAGASRGNLLDVIARGEADARLRVVAAQIAALGSIILLEPGWEMNGDWDYPWQGAANGGDASGPARFVAAWRHLVSVFHAEGADNARWVFNANVGNPVTRRASGRGHWNWYGHYYPGDDVVDYIGAHGFNAPSLWGGPHRPFGSLFDGPDADHVLSDQAARFPSKPIIVGELATEESADHDKAAWIADAFARMHGHPRIVGSIWFDMKKEADWRLDSSAAARRAYREAVEHPRVRSAFVPEPSSAGVLAAAR